jgi:hypothetical protein
VDGIARIRGEDKGPLVLSNETEFGPKNPSSVILQPMFFFAILLCRGAISLTSYFLSVAKQDRSKDIIGW